MVDFLGVVTGAIMIVILLVVVITGACAVHLACSQSHNRRKLLDCNKFVVPGFPCNGTLFVLATDGVMYVVPEKKAVIKTDMIREVHSGRIVQGCDENGHFTYVNERAEENGQFRGDFALDHIHAPWSVGSAQSQESTASMTEDEPEQRLSAQDELEVVEL